MRPACAGRVTTPPPQHVGSCRNCLAWGITRVHGWLCRGRYAWHRRALPIAECRSCVRAVLVNADGICRLCRRQTIMVHATAPGLDDVAANRQGQQLFIADMFRQPGGRRPKPRTMPPGPPPRRRAIRYRQLVLVDLPSELGWPDDDGWAAPAAGPRSVLEQLVWDQAARYGWRSGQIKEVYRSVRIVLGLSQNHGQPVEPVKASQVIALARTHPSVRTVASVLEFLAEHDLLDDDRVPVLDAWFCKKIKGLPDPMVRELTVWFQDMRDGSTSTPRMRPRSRRTIQIQLRTALPTIHRWAAAGHTSLREISREDVVSALPGSGSPRALLGTSLRSIFKVLKARRLTFTNPAARIPTGRPQTTDPLLLAPDVVRDILNSGDPARAALGALAAFHGLACGQLRTLQLTDLRDGRLHLGERAILLAGPVRARLAGYLDHRQRTWPHTCNPHVFITRQTALRQGPASDRWILLKLGMTVRAIREDRILYEAMATGGDERRLADLFGLSVKGATRYTTVLDHPGFAELKAPKQLTSDCCHQASSVTSAGQEGALTAPGADRRTTSATRAAADPDR